MIKINYDGCEFQYKVDTLKAKTMNEISPSAFELACITADVHTLMGCIDKKFGKGVALKVFGMASARMYTLEEIEQADKEINENE